MSSNRGGVKVSGLIAAGKVAVPVGPAQNAFTAPPAAPAQPAVSAPTLAVVAPATPAPGIAEQQVQLGAQSVEIEIDIELLDDSPFQSRRKIDPEHVDEIGQSLEAAGQRTPITVRRKPDGRYELIKGHTRKYGAKSRGIRTLRALVVERSDRDAKLDLWLDNEGRKNTDYEYGLMFRDASKDGYATTQKGVADLFGCSQSKVSKCLAMLDLPPQAIAMLDDKPGVFGAATAAVIQDLWKQHPDRTDLIVQGLQRIVDGADQNGLSSWVQQQMARSKKTGTVDRHHIPHPSGAPAFVTMAKGRDLVLRLADSSMNMDEMRKAVEDALQRLISQEK